MRSVAADVLTTRGLSVCVLSVVTTVTPAEVVQPIKMFVDSYFRWECLWKWPRGAILGVSGPLKTIGSFAAEYGVRRQCR